MNLALTEAVPMRKRFKDVVDVSVQELFLHTLPLSFNGRSDLSNPYTEKSLENFIVMYKLSV